MDARRGTAGQRGTWPQSRQTSYGIALPIEKQQNASPATDRLPHGQNKRPAQYCAPTVLA